MKKFNFILILFLTITSCKLLNRNIAVQDENTSKYLTFKDWGEVQNEILNQLQMSIEEKNEWDKKMSFSSQYALFNMILLEEDKTITAFYDKHYKKNEAIDKNVLENEYHSDLYKKFVIDKKIFDVTSTDSTESLEYKLFDKSLSPLINLEGFIKVNDTLYKFEQNSISFKPTKKGNSKKIEWTSIGNLKSSCSLYGENEKTYYDNGNNNKRVRVWVEGVSSNCNCSKILISRYSFNARAEKYVWSPTWKNWGRYVWKTTGNYAPCINIFGKWIAEFHISTDNCLNRETSTNFNCSSSNKSPLNFSHPNFNYLVIPLCPNGYFLSNNADFVHPGLTVTNKEFYFSICGIGDKTFNTVSCVPNASFTINNSLSNPVNVNSSNIILNGYASTSCSGNFLISIQESDQYWGRYGVENYRWLTQSDYSNFGNISSFNIDSFNNSFLMPITFQSGKYYRIKLAVGNPWNENTILIRVN